MANAGSNRYTNQTARSLGFASGLEAVTADQLNNAGREHEYETDNCRFSYFTGVRGGGLLSKKGETVELPAGSKVVQWHEYTCDFRIIKKDGGPMLIETKGYFKPKDRAKHQALKKQYPDIDLRIIFQSNGKVSHKTSYAQWAEKQGIKYHIPTLKERKGGLIIPQEWLDE